MSIVSWNRMCAIVYGWRHLVKATKVTAGLAECNGILPPGRWLKVTCELTACTPGSTPSPTLGNEYWKTLPFLCTDGNSFWPCRSPLCWTWRPSRAENSNGTRQTKLRYRSSGRLEQSFWSTALTLYLQRLLEVAGLMEELGFFKPHQNRGSKTYFSIKSRLQPLRTLTCVGESISNWIELFAGVGEHVGANRADGTAGQRTDCREQKHQNGDRRLLRESRPKFAFDDRGSSQV